MSFEAWVDAVAITLGVAGFLLLVWDNVKIRRINAAQREVISGLRQRLAKYYLEERVREYKERRDGAAR